MGPNLTRPNSKILQNYGDSNMTPPLRDTHNRMAKRKNTVKMIKQLFKKCKESGQSEYLALLNWRNTPTEGVDTSPAQRFFGRRCKTKLPCTKALLKPNYPTERDLQALAAQKQKQKFYYDRHTKPLKSIVPGETVRMRLPGESQWSRGTCTKQVDPRSYIVQVGSRQYRRNRRHILQTPESEDPQPRIDQYLDDQGMNSQSNGHSEQPPPSPDSLSTNPPETLPTELRVPDSSEVNIPLRRSKRTRKPPPLDVGLCTLLNQLVSFCFLLPSVVHVYYSARGQQFLFSSFVSDDVIIVKLSLFFLLLAINLMFCLFWFRFFFVFFLRGEM